MSEPEQAVSSLVDKEAEEESDYLQNVAQSSPLKLGLVHSSTTDTLDSVYLDPPITEAEVDLEISPVTQNEEANIDVAIEEPEAEITTEITDGTEIKEPNPSNLDDVAFSIGEKDDRNAPQTSPPSLSKYFGTNTTEDDPFATDFFGNIPGLDENGHSQTGALSSENDPLTAKSTLESSETQEIDINEKDNNEDEVAKRALEKSDSSKSNHRSLEISNVKSIDFDLELDNNEQIETPVDIENKDDFESFTADLADIETMDALGMSPAAPSYMNDYFRQTSQADSFTRQISQTSGKSSSSHDHSSVQPDIAAEIEEQLQDLTVESIKEDEIVIEDTMVENAPVPLNDLDKKTEAVSEAKLEHQPMFPPSTTLSPVDSPVHQPSFKPSTVTGECSLLDKNKKTEAVSEAKLEHQPMFPPSTTLSPVDSPVHQPSFKPSSVTGECSLLDKNKKTEAVSEAKLEHQPMFPPSTTLSPVDSPVHQPSFKPSTVTGECSLLDKNKKTEAVSEAKLEHQPMFPPSTTLSPVDSPVHQPLFKPSSVTGECSLLDKNKKTEAVSEAKLEHQPMFPPSTTLSPVDSPVHQPSFKPSSVTGECSLLDKNKKTEAVSEAKLEHQPMFPPSTTLSPVDSPVHQPSFKPSSVTDDNGATTGVPPSPEHLVTAFRSMSDSGVGEDAFAVALQMSDSDREHDAWIPSESTKTILISMTTQAPGSVHVDKDLLCRPSLVITEPQGDPVRDLVYRYMGEQEALKRQVLTAESVSQDFDGLKQLMATGCYRSAINLTGKLITEAGQAVTTDTPVVHSPDTLQLWYCRFSLMMKLRMYNVAESEVVGFKNFDTPDIYYEYYPHLYTGKRGSMLPFGMRILHAELPHHLGRSQETLDRLYYLIAIVQKIIKNLDDGLAEDGSAITITHESRTASTKLWKEREKQVYYVIGNTLVSLRDYDAALSVYEILLEKDSEHRIALLSGMGRIHLQIGNLSKAVDYFQLVKSSADQKDMVLAAHILMNRGFEAMCQNNFSEAYQHFKQAVQANPSNTSAVNNMAVCCLYLGRLKEALKTLEALVHGSPDTNLHEGILFNLCTLYELESSRALHKKQALLDLVSKHKGDGFPVVCLKMA